LITESNEHFDNVIIENELVTAKALTSINNRLKNIENGNDGLDEKYASKSEFESFSSTTADALKTLDTYITDINTNIEDNELVVSSALTDLDYRITNIEESGIGDVDFTVYATNESVDTKLANLVDSAPTTLDTLGELAAALKNNKDIVTVLEESIASKQSAISDLETIRSNASKGATALQSIPVEYVQINQLSAIATTGSYNDLSNKPTIPSIDGLATEEYVNTKFNEVFQNVSNGKFLIASAITYKGIYASDDETFQELSDKIDLIKVAPPGTNIVGYVDEQNDIYLSLSDLENGIYDLKYEDHNGLLADFYDIGTVEVN
jgi:predicted nuclease with TOPRIM domain